MFRRVTTSAVLALTIGLAGPHAYADSTPAVIATIVVGATPFGIDVTPDGSRVFVSNSTGASVSTIDTATRSVTATITSDVGTTPVGVAVDSSGTYAYVANYGAGTITRIAVATGLTTSINVGNALGSNVCANILNLAITPDDATIYAACQDQHRIIRMPSTGGAGTGTVLMSVNGTFPTDVALSSNGSTLVSALSGSNQAYIVDGNGSTSISVTVGPYAVAVSPVTGLAYLAGRTSGNVSVVNPTSRTVLSTITLGGSLSDIAITPDGTTALVSVLDQDVVHFIDLDRQVVTQTLTVGDGPQSLTISHDGRYAYTANRNSNTVSVISLPRGAVNDGPPPTASIQQFVRAPHENCDRPPADFVDFPGLGESQRNNSWTPSWAQWPNGGTGGFVCTRQPYYTGFGTWSVR